MPSPATSAPPSHLSPASRAFFAQIISDYELESQHVRLLTLCCEAADRGTLAREALAVHGLTYLDRFGAPHARPEVAIARDATIAVARLCRELDLDADAIAMPTRPPALASNRAVI
jgi:phage terminase small subunit